MNIAVLGTGFGAYHAKLYAKMPEVEKVIILTKEKPVCSVNYEYRLEKIHELWKNY